MRGIAGSWAFVIVCSACVTYACGGTDAISDDSSDASTRDGGSADGLATTDALSASDAADAALVVDARDGGSCDLSSPANCGACGIDCSGGLCKSGVCTLVDHTSAAGLYAPEGIALLGSQAFITVSGDPVELGRCATSGCATGGLSPMIAFDGGTHQPHALVANVGEGALYWTSFGSTATAGVFRTPLDGGATKQLNAAQSTSYSDSVALVGNNVLWTSDDFFGGAGVFSCPTAGCPSGIPTPFANAPNAGKSVIAAPDGRIIFAAAGEVRWCSSVACTGGSKLLAASQGTGLGQLVLAPDGDTLYWARTYPTVGIARAAISADAGAPAIVTTETAAPSSMLIVGDQLFWTIQGTDPNPSPPSFPLKVTTDGAVRKCRLPACATVVDVAKNEAAPVALATDGMAIYWVNTGVAQSVGGAGAVKKAPL